MAISLITRISNKRKEEYKATYDRLMNKAIGRKFVKGIYERHHIIPKSLGGANDELNIVCLTYREHFLAHWLLAKFTKGQNQKKMQFAFGKMGLKNDCNIQRKISGWQYEASKRAKKDAMLGNKYGKGYKHTREALEKIGNKSRGNQYAKGSHYKYTEEQKTARSLRMIGNTNGRGKKKGIISEETRRKIGNACRGSKSVNAKSIICLNDNLQFGSMSETALFYNVSWQSISRICRGIRRSTKGLKFKYFEVA